MENQLLNLVLPSTPPGTLPDGAPATVPFSSARVEELFYDSLCTCRGEGDDCSRAADCCGGLDRCFSDPTQLDDDGIPGRSICSTCREENQVCNDAEDCCDAAPVCFVDPDDGIGRCDTCRDIDESCSTDRDCCSEACVNGVCAPCLPFGEACQGRAGECCAKGLANPDPMLCVTLTSNPEFTCWCQQTGGRCSGEGADYQCCHPSARCRPDTQGEFYCAVTIQ
jgi:hypothetical protein